MSVNKIRFNREVFEMIRIFKCVPYLDAFFHVIDTDSIGVIFPYSVSPHKYLKYP